MDSGLLDPSASSRLWLALERANIVDEIDCLPKQLDAPVLEPGRSLSSGQRRRLALGRAIPSRSQLILIDEPTAHLDHANDCCRRAANTVRSWLPTDPPPSPTPTKSWFLQHGRVQSTGTHAELLRMSIYRKLIGFHLDQLRHLTG